MEKTRTRRDILEDEWYHVRHSGEIPEVALHSSIHYLTVDKEGPHLILAEEDLQLLCRAAVERYREIILRDLTPANRDKTIYRGILRSIANWRRLKRFCQRHMMEIEEIKKELPDVLLFFLKNEIHEVAGGLRQSSINCTFDDITSFALEFNIYLTDMEEELRAICLDF